MPRLMTYALRSLWARRSTTLATGAGIALLVFVLSASGMLAHGMRQTSMSAGQPNRALVLKHDSWTELSSRLDPAALSRASAAPGISRDARGQLLVTGEVVAQQMIGDIRAGQVSTLQVRGVDERSLDVRPEVRIVMGRAIRAGTAEAIIGRGVLGRSSNLVLGGSLELSLGQPVNVVGVFESGGSVLESEIWVELNAARRAFGMDGKLSSITAVLADADGHEAFALPLTQDKQIGLNVLKETAYYERISGGMADVVGTLGAVEAVIFSFGAVIATWIVLHAAVSQRRREVGVLRALGFPRSTILSAFLIESVALGLGGGAAGAGLALFTSLLDFTSINFATGQDVVFRFEPDASVLLRAVGGALSVGLLGGLVPAIHAARVRPVVALRS